MTIIFFATNRQLLPTGEFGAGFHPNVNELRYGTATIGRTKLYEAELTPIGEQASITIASESSDDTQLGSVAIMTRIRSIARDEKKDILVFVHGFNHSFRESVGRALQLKQWLADGGRDMVVVLFAWPSTGGGVNHRAYRADRTWAKASGAALGRALLKARDFVRDNRDRDCPVRIHLMAHSMGNHCLRAGIQSMLDEVGEAVPSLFDQVVLTAADDDDTTLSDPRGLAPLAKACRRITVYYNNQDLALKASDAIGNPDRLGQAGPEGARSLPRKIVPVNVSPVIKRPQQGAPAHWTDDPTGHQYYRNNDVVRDDVLKVLAGDLDEDIPNRTRRDTYWRLG